MSGFNGVRRTWIPKLSESPHLSQFADEMTGITREIQNLPYGLLSVVIGCVEMIKEDKFPDISPVDRENMYKAYYMIAGILMTQDRKKLDFTDKDVVRLDDVVRRLVTTIVMLESVLTGRLHAELRDGVWHYSAPRGIRNV